jgi:hypothetical protein
MQMVKNPICIPIVKEDLNQAVLTLFSLVSDGSSLQSQLDLELTEDKRILFFSYGFIVFE